VSQENVEIVEEMWRTDVTVDPTKVPTSFFDPEVTYEDEVLPDHAGEVYRGHEGMQRAWSQLLEAFEVESLENSIMWTRGTGEEVVTCHHVRGRGKGSGIELEFDYAYLWRFRAGLIIYCKAFRDVAGALEAAGLSE
jgi:ketosteroid isomerase-like protein